LYVIYTTLVYSVIAYEGPYQMPFQNLYISHQFDYRVSIIDYRHRQQI